MPAIAVILVIVLLLVFYVISSQRQFIKLDELSENALSQIGVQQQSRWDALRQIAKAAKGYATHESETLEDVISARSSGPVKTSPEALEKDNEAFNSAMSRINAVVERYPDLKADNLYLKAMSSIEGYEENVRSARMVYNDTVTKWNRLVKQIPSSIVARIFSFGPREYLKTNEEVKSMPDLDF